MRNLRVLVAYDGSRFHGWQRQDGFLSVQEALEEAVEALSGQVVVVHGSGRTDAGVHALGQVASFHLDTRLDDERLLHALNAHLVEGVVLRRLETCAEEFHAQFSARGKRYVYRVQTARFAPAFGREHTHWVREPLDLVAMRAAARVMVGEHDFSCFASSGSPRGSNVRHVQSVRLLARREALLVAVQGNGFLYNMVRTMVGTLLEVGRGKLGAQEVEEILRAKERARAGPTAPAAGLYLLSVLYPEPVLRRARGSAPVGLFPG